LRQNRALFLSQKRAILVKEEVILPNQNTMMQKHFFVAALGIAIAVGSFIIVARNIGEREGRTNGGASESQMKESGNMGNNHAKGEQGKEQSIESVILGIESTTELDASAFDDEEGDALSEVNADGESVNNFETSYDENNL